MLACVTRCQLCRVRHTIPHKWPVYGHEAIHNHGGAGRYSRQRNAFLSLSNAPKRSFTVSSRTRDGIEHPTSSASAEIDKVSQPHNLEDVARLARRTFGEKLPKDFLTDEEYHVYERLYGVPEELELENDVDEAATQHDLARNHTEELANVLYREDQDGALQEVIYEEENTNPAVEEDATADIDGLGKEDQSLREENETLAKSAEEEFYVRVEAARAAAEEKAAERKASNEDKLAEWQQAEPELAHDLEVQPEDEEVILEPPFEDPSIDEEAPIERPEAEEEENDTSRSHPLTVAGRSGTFPSTISLPRDSMINPITNMLSDVSNKQLSEVAQEALGGPGLPHSTSTWYKQGLKQQPIGLDAFQSVMKEMEGNTFLTAIMPGAYASIMNILVEVRKRLGSSWLTGLMRQKGGPRILDAGGGGAGVLAWREILMAESKSMNEFEGQDPPFGQSTVVTGSTTLRRKASNLLGDTTFIPRLPDYSPSQHHPSLERDNPQPRKQYDVIVAAYSLWQLKEDYMRKDQVQNLWSLLDPRGGVLILLEKGVPKGFELIAGARETLLRHHITTPKNEILDHPVDETAENRFGPKESGMIVAPCTNHGKCPMYIETGRGSGRKDWCHFEQRFIRPKYLQLVLDQKNKNHEDLKFSYIALQRGVDQRTEQAFDQGPVATEAAFVGHEDSFETSVNEGQAPPNPLSFPRILSAPIKNKGHVLMDVCTPAGKVERWTVRKAMSKQAYRDSRKSKWGDLWALGARTRVPRRIRVGRVGQGDILTVRGRSVDDADAKVSKKDLNEFRPKMRKQDKKPKHKGRILNTED